MSKRARTRPDKRAIVYYTGEATDIEAAFAKLTAERGGRDQDERPLQLNNGTTVNTKDWWKLPAADQAQRQEQ